MIIEKPKGLHCLDIYSFTKYFYGTHKSGNYTIIGVSGMNDIGIWLMRITSPKRNKITWKITDDCHCNNLCDPNQYVLIDHNSSWINKLERRYNDIEDVKLYNNKKELLPLQI